MRSSRVIALSCAALFFVCCWARQGHARIVSALELFEGYERNFVKTYSQWKQGRPVEVQGSIGGDGPYVVRTFYAKGNVVQAYDKGPEAERHGDIRFVIEYFRSAKFEGIVPGLKTGMSKDEVITTLGRPSRIKGSEWYYDTDTNNFDGFELTVRIYFDKQGRAAGMLFDQSNDYEDAASYDLLRELRKYDPNAPDLFHTGDNERKG